MNGVHHAALAVGLCVIPMSLRAQVPAWVHDPCAGLDCGVTLAGVGRAYFLPEMRISSAVAYAQAVRNLSASLADTLSIRERLHAEDRGQSADSAVKDWVESPIATALIKIYGGTDSDTVSVAIQLKSLAGDGPKVYAQEFIDPAARTLFVRLVMSRGGAALEQSLAGGFSPWLGRRIRMSSQDVRVGDHNEYTLWVEDDDAGLTWVEQWPSGGADLLQGGQIAAKYVFDRGLKDWAAVPLAVESGLQSQ
jgi:hypothetical protein